MEENQSVEKKRGEQERRKKTKKLIRYTEDLMFMPLISKKHQNI